MTKQKEMREGILKTMPINNVIEECLVDVYEAGKWGADSITTIDGAKTKLKQGLHSQGVVIKVDRELPAKLTNNIGCMSKSEIENFTVMVLRECGYPYTMKWTTAGDIVIEPFIYIDERHINEYPYMAKERVLHEIAHIDTHPQDDRHGELFHRRYAELVNRFLAGYVVVEPIIEEKK